MELARPNNARSIFQDIEGWDHSLVKLLPDALTTLALSFDDTVT